jgi:stage II sporulation protein B
MEQTGRDRERRSCMDKPNNNRTITIKINGNERKYKENIQPQEEKIEKITENEIIESTAEYDSQLEIAASQEAVDESFDWILPEKDDEIEEYIIAKPQPVKKKSSVPSLKKHLHNQKTAPFKSVFLSVLMAIIIGTSFGFVVLKLVISDGAITGEAPVANPQETTPDNNSNPATNTSTESLALTAIDTFIIQGGVFSSVDSAKLEQQKVQELGVPAQVIETNGQALLVLGVADSIANAKAIGTGIKEKGIDMFAKPYTFSGKELKELTPTESTLLKSAPGLYNSLVTLSSSGTLTESIDTSLLNEQKALLQKIDKSKLQSEKIQQLYLELEAAITKIENFNAQKQKSLITQSQQHLITAISLYSSL